MKEIEKVQKELENLIIYNPVKLVAGKMRQFWEKIREEAQTIENSETFLVQYLELIKTLDLYLEISENSSDCQILLTTKTIDNEVTKKKLEFIESLGKIVPINDDYAEMLIYDNDEYWIPIGTQCLLEDLDNIDEILQENRPVYSPLEFLIIWLMFFENDEYWNYARKHYREWKNLEKPPQTNDSNLILDYDKFYESLDQAGLGCVKVVFDMANLDTGNIFFDYNPYSDFGEDPYGTYLYPADRESIQLIKNEWEKASKTIIPRWEEANRRVENDPSALRNILRLFQKSLVKKEEK
jgi:hypothetical protein